MLAEWYEVITMECYQKKHFLFFWRQRTFGLLYQFCSFEKLLKMVEDAIFLGYSWRLLISKLSFPDGPFSLYFIFDRIRRSHKWGKAFSHISYQNARHLQKLEMARSSNVFSYVNTIFETYMFYLYNFLLLQTILN